MTSNDFNVIKMKTTIKVHVIDPSYSNFVTRAYFLNRFVGEKELTVTVEEKSKERCKGITATWYEAKYLKYKGKSLIRLNAHLSEDDLEGTLEDLRCNLEGNPDLQVKWCKELGYFDEDYELEQEEE